MRLRLRVEMRVDLGLVAFGFLCAYGFDRGLAHECEEESTKTQEASEKHAVFAVGIGLVKSTLNLEA